MMFPQTKSRRCISTVLHNASKIETAKNKYQTKRRDPCDLRLCFLNEFAGSNLLNPLASAQIPAEHAVIIHGFQRVRIHKAHRLDRSR